MATVTEGMLVCVVLLMWLAVVLQELLQSAESATLSCLPALVNRSEVQCIIIIYCDERCYIGPYQTPDLQTFMSVFHSCSLSSDIDYVDVIERVLIEKDFWACEVLSELLQASLVPSKSVALL